MTLRTVVLLALVGVTACGAPSQPGTGGPPSTLASATRSSVGGSPSVSPSARTNGAALGVLMLTGQGQLGGTTSTKYYLLVISEGGRIVRSATAGIQSAGWHFP